jgi:nucleotide-binding universal stress UspA family protein
MYRERILVTTDLSENSFKVIDKAASLALASDRWLEVLHVIEPRLFAFGFARPESEYMEEEADERLLRVNEAIAKKLHRRIERMSVQTRVGSIPATVEAFVHQKRASLLVIGEAEKPDESLTRRFLGSIARRIITRSPVSTLVIKTGGKMDYKRLYIPTDFSNRSLGAAAEAIALFPSAEILLDHVVEVPSEAQLVTYGVQGEFYAHFDTAAKEEAAKQMDRFIGRLRAQGGACASVRIRSQYTMGHMDGHHAAQEAQRSGADLTVLAADDSLFSSTFDIMAQSQNDLFLHP